MFTTGHAYITWLFGIEGTSEVAQFGLRVVSPDPPTSLPDWSPAVMQDLYDAAAALMGTSDLRWASYSELVGVKAAPIGTDGNYAGEPVLLDVAGGSRASGGTSDVPAQCTVVCGLRSGNTLGRANYGRMYLPHSRPLQVTNSPYMSDSGADTICAAAVVFLNTVADTLAPLASGPWGPVIMSSLGTGTTKAVAQVAVDKIIDTQRRRTHQLDSAYFVRTV